MVTLPRAVTDLKTYEVTGVLNPDATGTYEDDGEHAGKRSYELAGNGWFLWWDGIDTWYISMELGVKGAGYWSHADPNIEGDYEPKFEADGIATVTEI